MHQDILIFLQNWYQSKCNGKWEHEYGFDISTIDNPGWKVSISGEYGRKSKTINIDEDDAWIVINANDNHFDGYGSPDNLVAILKYAQEWLT
ncbi:Imm53 family immunity protein [Enterobacteriaceae bacterium ESL0689]|nr:Imm53 family immunity protein [Enterobacteriaceae bacterium ESL0689]